MKFKKRQSTSVRKNKLVKKNDHPHIKSLPSIFHSTVKIQSWIKRNLTIVWSLSTFETSLCLKQKTIKFVESNSVEYCFSVKELASFFLSSASFTHPIVRRNLNSIEISRFLKKASPKLRISLVFTLRNQTKIQQSKDLEASLTDWLASEAGDILDVCLSKIEKDLMDDREFSKFLWNYDTTTHEILRKVPDHLENVLHHHLFLVHKRMKTEKQDKYMTRLCSHIVYIQMNIPSMIRRPKAAAAEWLLADLRTMRMT